ncbi:MAG: hypothetical protein JXC85_06195 [Candidatus Aenigmarchaeota archaeon]|nr:hypothetical protein [Candidatus Aenigmarchaeota archaeon]
MVNDVIYNKIKEVARKGKSDNIKGIIYYEELMSLVGLGHENPDDRYHEIGKILDDINRADRKKTGLLITAVVVRKDTKMPGNGFFELAFELGCFNKWGQRYRFWVDEIKRVWDYWSKH